MCPSNKASKPGDTILKSFGFSGMLFHVSVIRSENQKRNMVQVDAVTVRK